LLNRRRGRGIRGAVRIGCCPSEEAAAPSEEASAPEEPAAPAEEPSEDAETPGEDPGTSVEGEVESLVDSLTDFEHKTETEIIEAAPVDEIDWSSLTVGFSQMENNMPWRIAQTESMQAAADEYGVNYIYADAQSDSAKQASDIEDMIAQGCDYIALAPRVEEGRDRILQTAKEQGTQIIIVDRMTTAVPGQDYLSNIVTNLPTEGLQVGEWMVDALTEKYGEAKGNVVTLQGTAGAAATIGRQNGFLRAIDGTDIQIIADHVCGVSHWRMRRRPWRTYSRRTVMR
jgi:ribose transport system substrate-binding protein